MSDPAGNPLEIELVNVAGICHEANRMLQYALGEKKSLPWQTCGRETQESVMIGVKHALRGATPEELHQSWCRTKEAQAWVYGPVKNETKRTHPNLVPYEKLPDSQKLKDYLFHSIIQTISETAKVVNS